MIERGFYKIKDSYFIDFPDEYLKDNKNEKRPCYFCFIDKKTNLAWMIPMSKQVKKYENIIEHRKLNNKPCDIIHVGKLDTGHKGVFLIQDMFPIIDSYIADEYTVNGNILQVTSESLALEVERKSKRILNLIHKDIKLQPKQPDVLKIETKLLQNIQII